MRDWIIYGAQVIFVCLLSYWTVLMALGQSVDILDAIDLVFHEAGHTLTVFFGEFVYVLGGTLGQLLVPVLLSLAFFVKQDWLGTLIMLWWAGQSLVNVGIYVADARAQELPLLVDGGHDWAYLLGKLHLLQFDELIGEAFNLTGLVIMIAAIIFSIQFLWHEFEQLWHELKDDAEPVAN